jgi:hypothetical protein
MANTSKVPTPKRNLKVVWRPVRPGSISDVI